MKLKINEIFYSIQGESSHTGKPCIFIRLTYCNLRCEWCDTEYSFYDGHDMTIEGIIDEIKKYNCNLVEVTGGEPIMQKGCDELLNNLLLEGYKVMLETGGSLPLNKIPKDVIKIVDFKCPFSKMDKKNDWNILNDLNEKDEIKFVIGNKDDYEWVKERIEQYELTKKWTVLLSCVYGYLDYDKLVSWILSDNLDVRFQLQAHKHIWDPEKKGV